jgi:hypothetical protein
MISRLRADLDDFRTRHGLDHVVMVNLASTEPLVDLLPEHETLQGLESLFDANRGESVRASTLYAYAALDLGFSLINFTPSNGCLLPGLLELGEKRHALCMGSDGKTGETLVKSALAPMFKYRNLRVLSWQGNKAAKVSTKDSLLPQILGYPLHTHVGIDFVPSLSDFKTAWDFIHFQGFLDQKMSLQFTWQGNDSILAAPLVLDMVRFTDFARRQGETGLMIQLASSRAPSAWPPTTCTPSGTVWSTTWLCIARRSGRVVRKDERSGHEREAQGARCRRWTGGDRTPGVARLPDVRRRPRGGAGDSEGHPRVSPRAQHPQGRRSRAVPRSSPREKPSRDAHGDTAFARGSGIGVAESLFRAQGSEDASPSLPRR